MSCLNYKVCRNYNEYLQLCKSLHNTIFDTEEWDDFFKAKLKINEEKDEYTETVEEYNGILGYSPDEQEYSLLVTYRFDTGRDRFGDITMQTWDWISLKELGLK